MEANGAMAIAKIMLANIAALKIPHEKSTVSKRITISVGVGYGCPSIAMKPGDLLKIADRELYKAKKNGRNQVQISSDLEILY